MTLAPATHDPAWPAPLALLLGRDAGGLLQTALAGVGGTLRSARVTTVAVQPSGASVVQYAAAVDRADGSRSIEVLAATTGSRIPPGAAVLAGDVDGERVQVGVWRWPLDPALPALAAATDPDAARAALTAAGVQRDGPVQVRTRAYRPGRRAVLELTGGGPRLFCKVVRPRAVAALRARHELLAGHLPVPVLRVATDDGLLVLPAAAGTPLRAVLAANGPRPDGPALDALLDRLPPALLDLPAGSRHAPGDHLARVPHFAGILTCTVGAASDRVRALADRLGDTDRGTHPLVPVHGDFYESQLLVDGDTVTGLLDVDTAGAGHRIDEWATLLAHLSLLTGPARAWGAQLLAHAERRHPRPQLRPRIAAAVLGLATGPFRVQQPGWAGHTAHRVALAEQWLAGT